MEILYRSPVIPGWVAEPYFPRLDETRLAALAAPWSRLASESGKGGDDVAGGMGELRRSYTGDAANQAGASGKALAEWLASQERSCSTLGQTCGDAALVVAQGKTAINTRLRALDAELRWQRLTQLAASQERDLPAERAACDAARADIRALRDGMVEAMKALPKATTPAPDLQAIPTQRATDDPAGGKAPAPAPAGFAPVDVDPANVDQFFADAAAEAARAAEAAATEAAAAQAAAMAPPPAEAPTVVSPEGTKQPIDPATGLPLEVTPPGPSSLGYGTPVSSPEAHLIDTWQLEPALAEEASAVAAAANQTGADPVAALHDWAALRQGQGSVGGELGAVAPDGTPGTGVAGDGTGGGSVAGWSPAPDAIGYEPRPWQGAEPFPVATDPAAPLPAPVAQLPGAHPGPGGSVTVASPLPAAAPPGSPGAPVPAPGQGSVDAEGGGSPLPSGTGAAGAAVLTPPAPTAGGLPGLGTPNAAGPGAGSGDPGWGAGSGARPPALPPLGGLTGAPLGGASALPQAPVGGSALGAPGGSAPGAPGGSAGGAPGGAGGPTPGPAAGTGASNPVSAPGPSSRAPIQPSVSNPLGSGSGTGPGTPAGGSPGGSAAGGTGAAPAGQGVGTPGSRTRPPAELTIESILPLPLEPAAATAVALSFQETLDDLARGYRGFRTPRAPGAPLVTQFGPDDEVAQVLPAPLSTVWVKPLVAGEADALRAGDISTVRGLLYRRDEVDHLADPRAFHRALGLGYAVDGEFGPTLAHDPDPTSLDLLVFAGLGRDDVLVPLRAGVEVAGLPHRVAARDHAAPWLGTGMAPGSTSHQPLAEFEVLGEAAAPVPHLAELWRVHADGRWEHLATHNARHGAWSGGIDTRAEPGQRVVNGLYAQLEPGEFHRCVVLSDRRAVLVSDAPVAPPGFARTASGDARRVVDHTDLTRLLHARTLGQWRGCRVVVRQVAGEHVLVDYAGPSRAQARRAEFQGLQQGQWRAKWVPFADLRHVHVQEVEVAPASLGLRRTQASSSS